MDQTSTFLKPTFDQEDKFKSRTGQCDTMFFLGEVIHARKTEHHLYKKTILTLQHLYLPQKKQEE